MSSTQSPPQASPSRRHTGRSLLVGTGWVAIWLILTVMTLWAIGALYFDLPFKYLRAPTAGIYPALLLGLSILAHSCAKAAIITLAGFAVVLAWWLTLQPSNDRNWRPDVSQTAWAELNGDNITLHNVRDCDYWTATDYTPHWETRVVDLSHLRGIDIAIDYWGSPWIAHPILSFQFDNAAPVCFSIETRMVVGQEYSAIGGLYRQYELIYLCSVERDVIRLRTNYRHEDIYLYHTTQTPDEARQRFHEYLTAMNELHDHPRWYNAVTSNCTTSIRSQHAAAQRLPLDWRILLNGKMDEMLYEDGVFAGGLPFPELKKSALIDTAAQAADASPNFSQLIRAGRPGFESSPISYN
jgi:hypothetical protein